MRNQVLALSLCLLVAVTVSLGYGQSLGKGGTSDRGPKKPKTLPPRVSDNRPVTFLEASDVFNRAEKTVRSALGIKGQPVPQKTNMPKKPVSRKFVIERMANLLAVVKRKIRLTPAPVAYNKTVLRLNDLKLLTTLNRLVKLGLVAKLGPLATGPGDTLTPAQFGDAVGFFLARIGQITNLPSNKWTPSLQSGEDR